MTLGEVGKSGVRTSDLKECQEILDTFFEHGHKELDTARIYAEGTTESVSSDSLHPCECYDDFVVLCSTWRSST